MNDINETTVKNELNSYYNQKVISIVYNNDKHFFVTKLENDKQYVVYYYSSLLEKIKQELKDYKNSSLDIPFKIWAFIVKNIHEDDDFVNSISSIIDNNQKELFNNAIERANIDTSDKQFMINGKIIENQLIIDNLINIEKGKIFWNYINNNKNLYSLCVFYSLILLGLDNISEELTEWLVEMGNIGILKIKDANINLYVLPLS